MNLNQQIHELLKLNPDVGEVARKRFDTFHDAVLEECGECTDAFNEILDGVTHKQDILQPGSLPTVVASCREVLVAAVVMAKIYNCEAINTIAGKWGRSGWAGLNQDAKGWCGALLKALPPENASADELHDLIVAKTLVGLLATGGIPSNPRSVKLSRSDKLIIAEPNFPIDE